MGERRDVYAKDEACFLGAQHSVPRPSSASRCPWSHSAGLACPQAVQQEHPPGPQGAGTAGDTWSRCFSEALWQKELEGGAQRTVQTIKSSEGEFTKQLLQSSKELGHFQTNALIEYNSKL